MDSEFERFRSAMRFDLLHLLGAPPAALAGSESRSYATSERQLNVFRHAFSLPFPRRIDHSRMPREAIYAVNEDGRAIWFLRQNWTTFGPFPSRRHACAHARVPFWTRPFDPRHHRRSK